MKHRKVEEKVWEYLTTQKCDISGSHQEKLCALNFVLLQMTV